MRVRLNWNFIVEYDLQNATYSSHGAPYEIYSHG